MQTLQSQIYSNSRVRGHGRLEWLLLSLMSFWFTKIVWKNERKELVFRVPEGYGNGWVDHMEMVGKETKLGYPPSLVFYVIELF